jgi:redox-sensing transcriptional repressor
MEHIPHTTRERYPHYIQVLRSFKNRGKSSVTSHEIAKEMNIGDTSVRRDLSFLGKLGRQGKGYDVDYLLGRFLSEVAPNSREDIVLCGLGNMGKALVKYNGFMDKTGEIVAIFEQDPKLIGEYDGIPVYHIKDIARKLPAEAKIAIMAIPKEVVNDVANILMQKGIKTFINFSDGDIRTRSKVVVKKFDLVSMIQEAIVQSSM